MRDKIAQRNRERVWTPEMRNNSSKAREGITSISPKITEESRRKMSLKGRGRKKSEETKKKIEACHKGKKLSEETKSKLAESWDDKRRETLATKNKEFRYMRNTVSGVVETVGKDDPRIASGLLVGVVKGLVSVLNPKTMTVLRITKDDEKVISGAYLHLRCKQAQALLLLHKHSRGSFPEQVPTPF